MYIWQSGFASHAEKAVKNYFDQRECFDNLVLHAAYVGWAVYDHTEGLDDHRCKVLIPSAKCPYMWAIFNDKDPANVVCIFSFRINSSCSCRSRKVLSCTLAFWTLSLSILRVLRDYLPDVEWTRMGISQGVHLL